MLETLGMLSSGLGWGWGWSQEVYLPRDLVPGRLSSLNLLRDPPAQDPRRSTGLNLPRDLVLQRLLHLNMLRNPPVQGSQEIHMPRLA